VATLAPSVTFWDAGEFIAAAQVFGIPHPPGTPLYVALGHVWILVLGPVFGVARAMNLLSAIATAAAGGMTAWLFAREVARGPDAGVTARMIEWRAVTAVLCAGLMASVWANATETEVYAIALLHGVLMLGCGAKAGDAPRERSAKWVAATAYAMLLAPAVHLSVLVVAPAAIALAARDRDGRWLPSRAVLMLGVLLVAAGIGRVSPWLVTGGVIIAAGSVVLPSRTWRAAEASAMSGAPGGNGVRRQQVGFVLGVMALATVAASALLVMLVRARHDPALDQGNPSTLTTLFDVVARRQYDVAGLWPRRAPAWLQIANVFQYVDWQVALGWGRGVFTSPARVAATLVFALLAVVGARELRRENRRLADAMLVLLASGTLGVAIYLNLRAGASLGWGVLPDSMPHEARERDYFFVYGFWAWGCLAGCGAMALVRARRWPAPTALVIALLPLAGNWPASDRGREPERDAAGSVAHALLESAPPGAVLFLAGDNDSYPLWYAQQVEGLRRDVAPVTMPLLSAEWYSSEIARRTGLRWRTSEPVSGTTWRHEQQAALIARAARREGRPVVASPLLTAEERALLGSGWRLTGVDYVSHAPAGADAEGASVDSAFTIPWIRRTRGQPADPYAVDGATETMLHLLECPRLARPGAMPPAERDSLEVHCNFR